MSADAPISVTPGPKTTREEDEEGRRPAYYGRDVVQQFRAFVIIPGGKTIVFESDPEVYGPDTFVYFTHALLPHIQRGDGVVIMPKYGPIPEMMFAAFGSPVKVGEDGELYQ